MKALQQYLFESSLTKVNILVGRFQPITYGHLKCCEKIWKQYKIPTVLCMIETSKVTDKHPFLTKLLWTSYKAFVKKYDYLADIIRVPDADVMRISEELVKKGYSVKTWTCGADRFEKYKNWVPRYVPSVELVQIERDDRDVSTTEVRQAIKADHKERFEELVPPELHHLYSKLKDAIDNI